jgi:AcrR family transcriptional regulator
MTIRTSSARRERTRAHARRDILESSARVFARRGYAAATLAELARAAGYAAPSLYRYFGSKEEIFASLLALVTAEVEEAFDAPVDRALPLPERFASLLARLQKVAEGRGEVLDLLAAQVEEGERQARLQRLLEGWLQKHVGRRELRVPQPLAARVMAGVLLALRTDRGRTGSDPGTIAHLAADLVLHGVSA